MTFIDDFQSDITSFVESVRTFVRTDLSCGCPDNVFEQVRVMTGDASFARTALSIVVGERLLVGFVKADEIRPVDEKISRIFLSGMTYRDSMGLNRLRLAISGDITADEKQLIENELSALDDRVHVHYFD